MTSGETLGPEPPGLPDLPWLLLLKFSALKRRRVCPTRPEACWPVTGARTPLPQAGSLEPLRPGVA